MPSRNIPCLAVEELTTKIMLLVFERDCVLTNRRDSIYSLTMKTLSLDVGDKYIGVAISDSLGIIAVGLEVITRVYLKKDIDRIKTIIEENGVEELVIGLPKKLNNEVGIQANKTIAFAEAVKENIDIPVQMWDERLTTVEAERMLISMNVSRGKRKKVIDKVAAQLILDGYLQFNKNKKKS